MDYQLAATGRIPIDTHLAGGWQKVIIKQLDWLAHHQLIRPSQGD